MPSETNAGVPLCSVALSGLDEVAELSMRSAAQLALDRYWLLSDAFDVAKAHAAPKISRYYATRLDDAVLRVIDPETTGT